MADIRIYELVGGQLVKIDYGNKGHKADSLTSALDHIKGLKKRTKYNNPDAQYVVQDFSDKYQSRIIAIVDPDSGIWMCCDPEKI